MSNNEGFRIRWFAGWAAMIAGMLIGWAFAEICWRQAVGPGIRVGGALPRNFAYYLLAILCSISVGVVGLALARFRDLPTDE